MRGASCLAGRRDRPVAGAGVCASPAGCTPRRAHAAATLLQVLHPISPTYKM
ncbi:uncharacterized protein AruCF_1408 [Achromobacter ruhlandii]|nr:uncharacterized protein AruCF_1408 [Achromobacter ruhlandii]